MKKLTNNSWRVGCHSQGPVQGKVVIVKSQLDLKKVKEGEIIVANQTDVNYTPQMLISAGILTVEGSRYSHAATFSRENNIPCLVGVSEVMDELSDGDEIILDTKSKLILVLGNERST